MSSQIRYDDLSTYAFSVSKHTVPRTHGPAKVSKALCAQHPAFKADAENISPSETGTTTPKILPNGWFSRRVPSLPPKAASEKVEEPSVSICGPLQQSALVLRTRRLPAIRFQTHRQTRGPLRLVLRLPGRLITGLITSVYQRWAPGALLVWGCLVKMAEAVN